MILIVVGSWITWFWIVNLNDPLGARNQGIRFVEGIQQRIADQFGERPAFWAVVLGAVIVSAIVVISVGRRRLLPSEGTRAGETNAEDEVAGVG